MIFVNGGKKQGKTEFVNINFQGKKVINKFHEIMRFEIKKGKDVDTIVNEAIDNADVIICDEIGCGIVPLDPFERIWREETGRAMCILAAKADFVYRLYSGIELLGGTLMTIFVCFICFASVFIFLKYACHFNIFFGLICESIFCWLFTATKSLKTESMKVYSQLKKGNIEGARKAVSMIVGRDTERLDEDGIIKAAVETVAENTSDGVIAPLIYIFIGGAPLGALYKAVNTMDSMVGYKNEKYLYFGRCSARLDDVLNFIPSRISAIMMIAAAGMAGMDFKGAVRISEGIALNTKVRILPRLRLLVRERLE